MKEKKLYVILNMKHSHTVKFKSNLNKKKIKKGFLNVWRPTVINQWKKMKRKKKNISILFIAIPYCTSTVDEPDECANDILSFFYIFFNGNFSASQVYCIF